MGALPADGQDWLAGSGWPGKHKLPAGYALNTDERELLIEVCRSLDDCEDLAAAVKRDGLTVAGSTGQLRMHPAVGELRATRALVGRLLSQLALPGPDGQTLDSPVRTLARTAANKRWAGERRGAV